MPTTFQTPTRNQSVASIHIGWRGILLVAITYVYFLIFAQFGFLKRLDQLAILGDHLKLVMAAMALGGIAASLLAARITLLPDPNRRLQIALIGAAIAALLTVSPMHVAEATATALLIGLSLGLWTVTLVANLRQWIGSHHPIVKVGLGTGLGYLVCNIPALFTATPREIAFTAAAACAVGIVIAAPPGSFDITDPAPESTINTPSFPLVLVWFTALIWFDSAAFYIIQNSPALKSGTWQGAIHLWRNGALHLAAALVSVWLISRRGLQTTLLAAFAALAAACLFLLNPAHAAPAAFLYPIGVSLYSVALVAYPSFVMPTGTSHTRTQRAGTIYAVAGWFGSAMGIGMAQNLHHVPIVFLVAAGLLFLIPVAATLSRSALKQTAAILTVVAAAFAIQHLLPSKPLSPVTEIERGRQVYIAEGCINCHSQYIRPNSADVELWGPAGDLAAIRRQQPPLIGNRRQGPDLSEVGSRRSALWLRMHFINPRDISFHSIMPSYAYLFASDERGWQTSTQTHTQSSTSASAVTPAEPESKGDALIAYMQSLKSPDSSQHLQQVIANWHPATATATQPMALQPTAESPDGPNLFNAYCATCHTADGRARTRWAASFRRLPPNLASDALPRLATAYPIRSLAAIIKFGIPGTDMAGHEYLPDTQIEKLAKWIIEVRQAQFKPSPKPSPNPE